MRRIVLFTLLFLAVASFAQIPVPQINLTGNIGCQGFPCVNTGTLVLGFDADHYMTVQETSAEYIKVTSSVSLTVTRSLITPSGNFPFTIENATTGGQSIKIIGPSGLGVTIANGATVATWNNGIDYVQVGVIGSGTVTSFAAPSGSWPLWLVPTVTNPTSAPSLAVTASPIPNSALANTSTTVNGQPCTLGSSCSISVGTGTITGVTAGSGMIGGGTSGTVTVTNAAPMVYPGAGIPNSTGSTWSTSYSTAGSGSYLLLTNANIQITMPTTAISANSCTSPASIANSAVISTSSFATAFASNPNSVTGWGSSGGLVLTLWPTSGNINWSVCNQSSASITGGAMTVNVGVV